MGSRNRVCGNPSSAFIPCHLRDCCDAAGDLMASWTFGHIESQILLLLRPFKDEASGAFLAVAVAYPYLRQGHYIRNPGIRFSRIKGLLRNRVFCDKGRDFQTKSIF